MGRQCVKPLQFLHICQLASGKDSAKCGAFNRFPIGEEYKQGVEVWVYLSHSFMMHLAARARNTTKACAAARWW